MFLKESFIRYAEDDSFRSGIDRLFHRIEDPVEEFKVRNNLSVQKFHWDQPVWTLSWMRQNDLQRMIQIAGGLGEVDAPTLSFSVIAYRDRPLTPREFSKAALIGFIDEVVLGENPNLPRELLVNAFNVANNIISVQ